MKNVKQEATDAARMLLEDYDPVKVVAHVSAGEVRCIEAWLAPDYHDAASDALGGVFHGGVDIDLRDTQGHKIA